MSKCWSKYSDIGYRYDLPVLSHTGLYSVITYIVNKPNTLNINACNSIMHTRKEWCGAEPCTAMYVHHMLFRFGYQGGTSLSQMAFINKGSQIEVWLHISKLVRVEYLL